MTEQLLNGRLDHLTQLTVKDQLEEVLHSLAELMNDGKPLHVLIERDGIAAELRIGERQAESRYRVNDVEAAILAAFANEEERMTGERIVGRTIYPYGAQSKTALSSMHRAGLLKNHAPGYSRTLAGTAALAVYQELHGKDH